MVRIGRKGKISILRLGQLTYLSFMNFCQNNLWESASSCSFGFVFSFIPILLIIASMMIGLLRSYPSVMDWFMNFCSSFKSVFDLTPFVRKMMEFHPFSVVDAFLSVWVVWMARKLFMSILQAMSRIFRSVSRRGSVINQLLTLAAEFLIVVLFVVICLASFFMDKFFQLPFFRSLQEYFPLLFSYGSKLVVSSVMYFLIFVATVAFYRFGSGTRPDFMMCIFCSLLSTGCFLGTSVFLNLFMNVTNYNIIYGTASALVLMMLKVYIFFIFFLFFAQMIYVIQFFDILLRAELYLLPDYDTVNPMDAFRRVLFINPYMLQSAENTLSCVPGDVIFGPGEKPSCVFYIKSGTVCEISGRGTVYYDQGSFFGDLQCILNTVTDGTATAVTGCEIIEFTEKDFIDLLQQNSQAAKKAISKISEYTARLYR